MATSDMIDFLDRNWALTFTHEFIDAQAGGGRVITQVELGANEIIMVRSTTETETPIGPRIYGTARTQWSIEVWARTRLRMDRMIAEVKRIIHKHYETRENIGIWQKVTYQGHTEYTDDQRRVWAARCAVDGEAVVRLDS